MSSLSSFPLPVHRFEDLKPGVVLPFIIESSSGVPLKAPSPPRIRRKEVDPEVDSGYDTGSSTTLSGRRLPGAMTILYPRLDADSNPIFHVQLKDSMEVPYIEDPADRYEPIPPQSSLTCLCEIIDPKARPGSPDSKNRQAVIKFGTSEALQKEQEIYGQLQEMQGTFMPIFMGRIRVPNSGTEAILLEHVDHVAISSMLKTPEQIIDLVEESFVFFERLIELNIRHNNWEVENIAITADGQLVFFGFGRCRVLSPANPGGDIFMVISQLRQPLGFNKDKIRAWQYAADSRVTLLFLQCHEKKMYPSVLSDEQKYILNEMLKRFPPEISPREENVPFRAD